MAALAGEVIKVVDLMRSEIFLCITSKILNSNGFCAYIRCHCIIMSPPTFSLVFSNLVFNYSLNKLTYYIYS